MLDAIGKYVGGKVVTTLCVIAAAGAGIWFWRHPEDLRALWYVARQALVWIGFAAALPWTSALFIRRVLAYESNTAGYVLLGAYGALDVLAALWLAGWRVSGALSWMVLLLGFVAAGAYNFVVCESLARHADR
ncbi:MAG: hypothetical protein L6Q92_12380 [Phycisphaerae bacterium]|nr:hypothetical protein [Phycisphaerae bacterium]